MIKLKCFLSSIFVISLILTSFYCCTGSRTEEAGISREETACNLSIGWSSEDITPGQPVFIKGQFHARISEGVMDPITATALAIESGSGPSSEKVIMISCDLVSIDKHLRDTVRGLLDESIPEINPEQVILNATHTHTGPFVGSADKNVYGIELDAMSPSDCLKDIAGRIARAAEQAWKSRKPGGISYGLGHAVIGHNRLTVDTTGKSTMYKKTNAGDFSHMEGYEDHSVHLLYTWDTDNNLTGIVINVACPAQVTESAYFISADYWHDTRTEIHRRLGKDIRILPQCSAAGDQSPHMMIGEKAEERMYRIMWPEDTAKIENYRSSMGLRKQIALRIADAVTTVLPYMKEHIEWSPEFEHQMDTVKLPRRLISHEDVNKAMQESEAWKEQYNQSLSEIKDNPGIRDEPRWYADITRLYTLTRRGQSVKARYELQMKQPRMPVEVHVIRIDDIVLATNPFELYLDYGMRIKSRCPAVQTFVVQLAGSGSYLPTSRSIAGGAYGAVPASTFIGPEGGQELVEETLELIHAMWDRD